MASTRQHEAPSSLSTRDQGLPSTPLAGPSAVRLSGFEDATSVFRTACAGLRKGEMVHADGFTMFDSMSAIQIMDPRMDSGMDLPLEELPEDERATSDTQFDPTCALRYDEVCWIMDRALACEVAWHSGSALSQTLYTCLYMHELPRLTRETLSTSHDQDTQPELVTKVLRAYISALVKSCDIVWTEMTKQNLYDGEDFSGDKAGLSLLEDVSAEGILAQLEEASVWLSQKSDEEIPQKWRAALLERLGLRKQLLLCISLLGDESRSRIPVVSMHVRFAQKHLRLIRPDADLSSDSLSASVPLMSSSRAAAPTERAQSCFDPAYNRRLVANAPLRPINLPSNQEVWNFWQQTVGDLVDVVALIERPSVLGWKMLFSYKAAHFKDRRTAPYVRSLLQSVLCTNNVIAGHLSLTWLTDAFFEELALVTPGIFRRLAMRDAYEMVEGGSHAASIAPLPLGQSASFFAQRVAGFLVNYFAVLCQNRPRQKRNLGKAYAQWVDIAEEASELGSRLEGIVSSDVLAPDSLFASTQHISLSIMSDIVFSGFELELYRQDEWASIYWISSRIAAEQEAVTRELVEKLDKAPVRSAVETREAPNARKKRATLGYLRSQGEIARAFESACRGIIWFSKALELLHPLSSRTPASEDLQCAIFQRRLKWIAIGSRPHSAEQLEILWEDFSCFVDDIHSSEPREAFDQAKQNYACAVEEVQRVLQRSKEETRTELCDEAHRQFFTKLAKTCRINLAVIDQKLEEIEQDSQSEDGRLDEKGTSGRLKVTWRFDTHVWFPTAHLLTGPDLQS